MNVVAGRDRCIGAGMCVLLAPAVFGQDPHDGVVVLLDESPPETERPAVEQAVRACPAAVLDLLS